LNVYVIYSSSQYSAAAVSTSVMDVWLCRKEVALSTLVPLPKVLHFGMCTCSTLKLNSF